MEKENKQTGSPESVVLTDRDFSSFSKETLILLEFFVGLLLDLCGAELT